VSRQIEIDLGDKIFDPVPMDKFARLDRDQLIEYIRLQNNFNQQLVEKIKNIEGLNSELALKKMLIEEQWINIKGKLYGKSSERQPQSSGKARGPGKCGKRRRVQLPSERYPEAQLIEQEITFTEVPECSCCKSIMKDSGLTEDSEFLTTIPAQYLVIRQRRHKYRCTKCFSCIKTAPLPPRINPGSSYSDNMIVDVAMSKYCDLIPVERYVAMAAREGFEGLPAQSLIDQTHKLADFVHGAYERLKSEILAAALLHADETPHRMLEGSEKDKWYLWGFSTNTAAYFECHDTRSGDVAVEFLKDSQAKYLVSDVFSGYGKAVKETNKVRDKDKLELLQNVYCNAHARRKFKESQEKYPDESQTFLELYAKIYRLEKIAKARPNSKRKLRVRRLMKLLFEQMRALATEQVDAYSSKSKIAVAMKYYLKNYKELTLFIGIAELPIDNNRQESLLRNPVIGRKTWYGTHSQRGAQTLAVLFSLVESCKLNKINPRLYFKKLIENIHQGLEPFTPAEFNTS
jgi:transposase